MPLLPFTVSSAPGSTFTETLVLPVVATTGVLDGFGVSVLLHVTVCPLAGAALSQAASAGDTRSRIKTPSADEMASRTRFGTRGDRARRIRSSVKDRRLHCP